ncbi:hypothetical protein BTO18_06905 [Polaribacter porphyrae]|uniref:Uncharacterized protein n=2 Tax=Polaribacter porphyrae TaxID=1137780 RepID=A0A2S7WMT7_9FLAO|nr:hypothetical protein BTO18_06905 [Polaribacter porphyrae]
MSYPSLDYEKVLSYRSMVDSVPKGYQKRNYYNILSRLETYLGNYKTGIDLYDIGNLEPNEMVHFDSLGNISKKELIYPKKAFKTYPSSLLKKNHIQLDFDNFIKNIDNEVKVIAFNELHHINIFRSTLYSILPTLKEKGFNYLVLESFHYNLQEEIEKNSYPKESHGYYNGETVLGDVIRNAISHDFKLISYDYQNPKTRGSLKEREKKSFQFLLNRTFKQDSNAKIILLAGGGHISEANGRFPSLGNHFNSIGINPTTIDQKSYYDRNVPKTILKRTLFKHKNPKKTSYDYMLINPKTNMSFNRPNWLWKMDRKPVLLEKKKIQHCKLPIMVEAILKSEGKDAVPLDRIDIKSLKDNAYLALRKGIFTIRITNKYNKVEEFELIVN